MGCKFIFMGEWAEFGAWGFLWLLSSSDTSAWAPDWNLLIRHSFPPPTSPVPQRALWGDAPASTSPNFLVLVQNPTNSPKTGTESRLIPSEIQKYRLKGTGAGLQRMPCRLHYTGERWRHMLLQELRGRGAWTEGRRLVLKGLSAQALAAARQEFDHLFCEMKKDRNKVNPGSHQPFFPPSMLLLSLLAQLFHPVPGTGSGFSPTCLHRQAAACPNQLLPGATQRPAHSLPAHSPPATGSGSQGSCLSLPTAASYTEYGRRMRRRYARADLW